MRRIGHLTDVARDNGNSREVIDEIVALSKKYGIITEFTSFLVTDPSENHRIDQASSSPVPLAAFAGGASAGLRRQAVKDMVLGAPSPQAPTRFHFSPNSIVASNQVFDRAARSKSVADSLRVVNANESPLASFGAVSGKAAVRFTKEANDLKESRYLAKADGDIASSVKAVADKTFYLRDGIWVDSAVDPKKARQAKVITFASKEYFELVHLAPQIAKYLSVGQQVLLEFKGQMYKIIAATTTTG